MDLQLTGRRALITGGSRGIGLGIARSLAAEGVNLVLIARDDTRLSHVASEICSEFNVDVRTHSADLYENHAADDIASKHADVDILVNNANTPSGGSLESVSDEQWMHNWSLKPFGYIRMMRAFVPILRARGGGVIANMIGAIGQLPSNKAIYSAASCSALTTITEGLAHDLSNMSIRVLGFNSWVVNTEKNVHAFRERAATSLGDAARWPELHSNLPFKRAAEPSEIGDLLTFCVSPRAAYLSGQVISLDGGYVASSLPTIAKGALAHE
ncbi:SDR family NAD(P)-dependent oxidoreductase [Sphingomonas nostoxanthinifaciens]|uniref:SDR family NAD(P)-dependent oxidoreductase n=1 Tax=Sphingomonas nostoxanthinifaciens TaxID=2872652 RepID=UPI001CC20241|nr:SDR family NAD(P)-dependent oxidoreductase [Sphingomonas nostoxanthinifaciens]UAK23804.1 SDR family NAD(P)-dependent oxidoreductase [Sphingomonas nostoxanthinifaciens]